MDAKIDTAQKDPHVVRSRFAYSLGAFGHDAFFALLSTYFMMYVTGHLFISSDKHFDNKMVWYVTIIIIGLLYFMFWCRKRCYIISIFSKHVKSATMVK